MTILEEMKSTEVLTVQWILHLTGWVMYMLINILQHMMLGKDNRY